MAVPRDYMQRAINFWAVIFMWVASALPQITTHGRSAKEFSDLNDSLLVPPPTAFAIWGPIFLLSLVYAMIASWNINRTRVIFVQTRLWTAFGFILTGLWSLTAYYAPLSIAKWATVLIFIPLVTCFLRALYIFHKNRDKLDASEQRLIIVPIALIAGWTSLAAFLNVAPLIISWLTGPDIALEASRLNMCVLGLALIFALTIIFKLGRIWSYAGPIIWGLGWLSYRHTVQDDIAPQIGYLSILGIGLIIIALLMQPKPPKAQSPINLGPAER